MVRERVAGACRNFPPGAMILIQNGGEASSSAVTIYALRRNSTVGATLSLTAGAANALTDAIGLAPATAPAFYNTCTTAPVVSATLVLLRHSFNAYGGLVRWQARQGEELTVYGTAVNVGDVSYCGDAGCQTSAAVSGHMIYEAV